MAFDGRTSRKTSTQQTKGGTSAAWLPHASNVG